MAMNKQLTKLLIGICILIGVTAFPLVREVKALQTEPGKEQDTFFYDGTNAAAYQGESVFVITERANAGITKDMQSYEITRDLDVIRDRLKNVRTIKIDDTVTDLYIYILRFFGEATTLHIGKKVNSIHMGDEEDLRIEDYINRLSTIDVDAENEYFKAEDNVLYSLDMTTLYLYAPGKTDTFFSIPDTVINLKKAYMGNSSLQELEIGKAFGPLDTPYSSGDFFYSLTDGLSALQRITVDAENANLSAVNGVLYDKGTTKTIAWPKNLVMEHVTFPSTLKSIALGMIGNKEMVKTITLSKAMEELWVWDFLSFLIPFPNLEKIIVPSENEHYRVWKGGLYYKKNWTFCGFPQKSPLTTLEFPQGCRTIELRGDEYPNIDTIIIPSTFLEFNTHEGGGFTMFFEMFPKLRSIQISSKCKNYKSVGDVVFDKKGTKLIAYPVQKEGTSYRIPDSVKEIEWSIFAGSTQLKTITIGKNLEANQSWYRIMECSRISEFKTAKNCKNYTCKDGVLYDKKMATLVAYPPYKKAADYEVPDTVTDISYLYVARYIENLFLGKRVKELCDFSDMNRLKSITVSKENPYYMSKNGVLYDKKRTTVIYDPMKKDGEE